MTRCFSAGDAVSGFMKDASKSFNILCSTATDSTSLFAPFAIMDWNLSGELVGQQIRIKILAGLYILEFSPPRWGGEKNQRVWRWGRKSKGEKREKKEIWGKYNFLQYQIIKLN